MDRRHFLSLLMTSPALARTLTHNMSLSPSAGEGYLVVSYGHEKRHYYPGYTVTSCTNAEARLISTAGNLIKIKTPAKGHEFIQHPEKKNLIFSASRWGKHAFLLDAQKNSLKKVIELPGDESFQGHSLFSGDGRFIYVAHSKTKDGTGAVCVLDSETLQIKDKISTGGLKPHQFQWLIKDKLLAAINSQSAGPKSVSSYSIIDVTTQKIVEKKLFSDPGYAHFLVLNERKKIIGGRVIPEGERLLAEIIGTRNEQKIHASEKDESSKGDLSEIVNLLPSRGEEVAVLGAVGLKRLYFYDLKHDRLIKSIPTKINPLGLHASVKDDLVYVCFGESKTDFNYIEAFRTKDFFSSDILNPVIKLPGGNGSHMSFFESLKA